MKKIILSIFGLVSLSNVIAQGPVVIDTVITGNGYATNVWYSLANDEQATSASTNWDLALTASGSPQNPLGGSILFNSKVGKVYAIPNATIANSFDTLETVNFDALTPLVNNDSAWVEGALSRAAGSATMDYGWANYNPVNHNLEASRIFVVKYNDNTAKKFYVTMFTTLNKYSIVSADLENGATQTTKELVTGPYVSKNYYYYKIDTNTELDREPASAAWDFTFLQYDASLPQGGQYLSFGILNNLGVEAVKVSGVTDVAAFNDHASQTFSTYPNAIGYNWKNAMAQSVPSDVVYFVKDKSGDIWKLVFTEFTTGSGVNINRNVFSKQNLTTLSIGENAQEVFVSIYPNPSNNVATIVVDAVSETSVKVIDLNGKELFNTVAINGLQTIQVATSELNNGVYLVQVSNGTSTSTQRLVVQH